MASSDKEVLWKYVDINFFNKEHLKDFTVRDVKNMFQREKYPMVPELAYLAFLLNGPWGID